MRLKNLVCVLDLNMAVPHHPLPALLRLLFVLALLPFSWALKFDLQAFPGHSAKHERCIRNFVAKDTLVVVTATVSGQKGDGQVVNMHVSGLIGRFGWSASSIADALSRSRMRLGMSTEGRKMLSGKRGWLSLRRRIRRLTCASKISLPQAVCNTSSGFGP